MKTNFKKLFVFFISLLLAASTIEKANATHAAGADISYCWVGPGINTYRITYTFYRNCGDPINPNPTAEPNTVTVRLISASCGYTNNSFATLPKAPNPNGQEVSLACANVLTYCNGGTEQGYRKWVYTAVVTLPQACSDWQIIVDVNARNNNITTLNNPGGQSLTVVATLNNLYLTNQSPQQHDCAPSFSNPPLAFVCANQLFTYNHSAIDADGDSLVYSVVSPMQSVANVLQPVNFNSPPYSATNPITTSTGFNINPLTGDLSFIPTANGELGVAAFRVDEYRNGILIGSVMRDMQIKVVVCSNTLPTASGVNGNPVYTASVCADNQLCFTINSIDPDPNDTLLMWWNNSLPTATFTVSGTPHPVGQFCWTPTSADVNNNPNTFSVTVRDNACPQNGQQVFTYAITVNPHPVIQTTGNQSVCLGQPATLSASGASTYSWSPSSYLNTTSGPTVISTPPANQTYTVTGTSADGCTGSTTVSVIVNPNPLVVYPANPVICFGHDTLITISGAASYVWTPQTGIVNHNPQYSQVTVSPSSTTIYTVTGYSAEGCSASISFTVTVNPNPVPVVTSNSPICDGSTLTLSATGGTVYSWTGPNSFSSSSSGPSITGAGLSASGTYNVLVTDANSCSASGSVNVTVNPNPVPVLNSNSPVCAGSTLNLTASGGTTYSWTGPNSFSSSTQNPSISNATIGATGIYTVDVGDANGCHTVSTINATVNANPVPVVSSNSPICAGSTLNLSASGGTTYTWSGPNSFSSSTQNPSIGNAAVNATGTYSVIVGDANGCHTTATVSVTVNANPVPVVGSNSPICAGSTLTLSASGGTTYSWTGPDGFSSSISNPAITGAAVTATGTYSVNVGDANNCHTVSTVNATVNANPVPVVGNNSPICDGFNLNLTATGGTTFAWTGPNGFTSGAQNPSIASASLSATGTYTVDVGDANNCHTISTTSATVNPNPTPSITPLGPTEFCAGGSVMLDGGNYSSYQWNTVPAQSTSSITVSQTSTFNLQVWDNNGCTAVSAPITITVDPNPVPVITPDGPIAFCIGGNVRLDAGVWDAYEWSGAGETTSFITVSVTRTVDVTVWDNHGCQGTSAPLTVTVNPLPPAVVTPAGPVLICSGSPATLSANTGTGYTYQWYNNSAPISGAVGSTYLATTTGLYSVRIVDANTCTNLSNSVQVTQGTGPAVTVTASPGIGCLLNTIFVGYGPQDITLTAQAPGAVSYLWSPGGQTTQSITVTQPGNYSVIAYDINGCPSPSPGVLSPPINVIDIRCGHNLNKVVLCHVPEGNFNNPQTLCIGQPAIDPHLRLHRWDCLGPCSLYYPRTNAIDVGDFYVIPSPNPFDNALTLHILTTEYDNPVKVKVMDVTGRLVETYNDVTEQTEIGLNLKAGVYIAVVTQGDNKQVIQIVKTK